MKRAVAVATALVLATLGTLVPLTPASAAPVLTVALSGNHSALPGDPVRISDAFLAPVAVRVGVGEGATHVGVAGSGEGLTVSGATTYPTISAAGLTTTLFVQATTRGFHALTVTVTADGAAPVTATLDRLWVPDASAGVPATGSLAGRTWAYDATYSSYGKTYRQASMLWFLDGSAAFLGNVDGGRPDCRRRVDSWSGESGCLPYAYDAATGLVQVGANIGRVRADGVSLSGYGVGEIDNDTPETREFADLEQFTIPLGHPEAGSRFARTFRYSARDADGRVQVTLLTRRDGTFHLERTGFPNRDGRYEVRRKGVLRLTGRRARPEEHTFLGVLGPDGRARPQKHGGWLTFFYDYGRTSYTDGFPVVPRH